MAKYIKSLGQEYILEEEEKGNQSQELSMSLDAANFSKDMTFFNTSQDLAEAITDQMKENPHHMIKLAPVSFAMPSMASMRSDDLSFSRPLLF